jgi:E3 ubiquitin-protein ligase ZSWIM2
MKSWREAKEDLESTTLFLVHRTGPTVYQIKDEVENSCRVMLGDTHVCTCKEKGFCMHILFVILKVLRIPLENHLSQKSGFTDAEIDVALAGNFEERVRRPPRQPLIKKKKKTTTEEENTVDRQILNEDEEEICPICQDDMKKEHALTWCRKGCGNNIHAKCMKMYAQYKSTTKKDILCPLCRENWGPMAIHIINDDCECTLFVTEIK